MEPEDKQDSGLIRWEGEGGAVIPDTQDPPHGPDLSELDDWEPTWAEQYTLDPRD